VSRAARALAAPAAVFALALAVRALYLLQIHDEPVFELLVGDARRFYAWAHDVAAGDWLGDEVFYQAPLYPYFLAGLVTLVGPGLLAIKSAQVVVGSLTCAVLARAGARLFDARTGVGAGVLLALYPPAIFGDTLLQKSVLVLLFAALLLLAVARIRRGGGAGSCLALGVVLGALVLLRENTLALAAVLAGWLVLRSAGRARWLHPLAFGLGLAAALAPVAARNLAVSDGGELHLTTTNLGTNLYIGNRRGASGVYQPLVFGHGTAAWERDDAVRLAEEAVGRPLAPGEVSRYWASRAAREVASDPGAWLALMGRKALLFLNAAERMDTEDQYTFADASSVLRGLGRILHFGVLLPLAVFGLVAAWRRAPAQRLLWILALAYAATVLLFFVNARFRLPVVVFWMPSAAAGLVALPRMWQAGEGRRLATAGAAALAAAALANLPLKESPLTSPDRMRASTALNLGVMQARRGHGERAVASLERAAALAPDHALAHHLLGNELTRQGRLEEALAAYRRALRARPGHPDAHNALGEALLRTGRAQPAIRHFGAALRADPDHAEARANLERARAGRAPEPP